MEPWGMPAVVWSPVIPLTGWVTLLTGWAVSVELMGSGVPWVVMTLTLCRWPAL